MSSRKRSAVWKYFIKNSSTSAATCKFCLKKLKTSGNTTNLYSHLQKMHIHCINKNEDSSFQDPEADVDVNRPSSASSSSSIYSETATESRVIESENELKQSLITNTFSNIQQFKPGGRKELEVTKLIMFMIVQDNLPLSFVESPTFKKLMHMLAPHYKLPSRRTFTRMVDHQYELQATLFSDEVKDIPYYSLTADIWTDCHQTKSYLGITIHYLKDTNFVSSTIGVYPLEERHTAAYISQKLEECCQEWKINKDKVLAIVTDNGQNMVKATCDTFGSIKHVHCFAHTLNLVAENAIKSESTIFGIIRKLKCIVTWFKQSVVAADALRKAQIDNNVPENKILKLIQSVDTRWNSKYYMVQRFLELHKYINNILIAEESRTAPDLINGYEIKILEELKDLLQPLEMVTKELSGEKYVTISKIIPIIHCMEKGIEKVDVHTNELKTFKHNLEEEINKRFGRVEEVERFAIATILDPRFKKIHFNNFTAAAKAVLAIRKEIEVSTNILPVLANSVQELEREKEMDSTSKDLWEHHTALVSQLQNNLMNDKDDNRLHTEVSQYINNSLFPLNSNPIQIWEEMKLTYPHLYVLAQKYLQIPATSVPAERLFSKTGLILNDLRCRLKPNRLNKLLFLSSLEINDWIM